MRKRCILLGLLLVRLPVAAQQKVDETFDFQPGDVIAFHSKGGSYPDQTWRVLSCIDRGDVQQFSCLMRQVEPAGTSNQRKMTMHNYSTEYNVLTLVFRGAAEPTAVAAAGPVAAPRAPTVAQPPAVRPALAIGNDQCTASVADASRASAFGTAVAKWAIYDNYARRAHDGGISSPIAVGVTFESLAIGVSEPNAVLTDAGRGAHLRNDAAPRGATLYSTKSVYRICERYSNVVKIRRMEARHVCFKDTTGDWGCGIDGYPKTEWLQR